MSNIIPIEYQNIYSKMPLFINQQKLWNRKYLLRLLTKYWNINLPNYNTFSWKNLNKLKNAILKEDWKILNDIQHSPQTVLFLLKARKEGQILDLTTTSYFGSLFYNSQTTKLLNSLIDNIVKGVISRITVSKQEDIYINA